MKTFFIYKKHIIVIMILTIISLLIFFALHKPFSIAIELSSNSEISDELKEEIVITRDGIINVMLESDSSIYDNHEKKIIKLYDMIKKRK